MPPPRVSTSSLPGFGRVCHLCGSPGICYKKRLKCATAGSCTRCCPEVITRLLLTRIRWRCRRLHALALTALINKTSIILSIPIITLYQLFFRVFSLGGLLQLLDDVRDVRVALNQPREALACAIEVAAFSANNLGSLGCRYAVKLPRNVYECLASVRYLGELPLALDVDVRA